MAGPYACVGPRPIATASARWAPSVTWPRRPRPRSMHGAPRRRSQQGSCSYRLGASAIRIRPRCHTPGRFDPRKWPASSAVVRCAPKCPTRPP
ncbi:hypothetical protein XEULMG905_00370 [Xanthomonas euvesicatoria]|nr:hypothetical protein XEULMG905_00370 [Xanthomonas euvesicatoria]